ncbi:Hypothetical protein FKW44_008284 [Caligus rogercresseyi]|uniref:Uncharacterized protein n=1 Tax=Caligus rogercresseyi TaxID=217165 RepID=A0A7T8KG23_CALRO|nr:Hypothetical protein FKW44_008284 [Caligus rogercresseyi]
MSQKMGGLGLVDFQGLWKTLLYSWCKRITEKGSVWAEIINLQLMKTNGKN